MDKILVFDFGSQTTQLISRRIREIGVYSEVVPGESAPDDISFDDVKGIILSGSPWSVYEPEAPKPDQEIFQLGIPILGICYGFHQMTSIYGGEVLAHDTTEYGRSALEFTEESDLFYQVPNGFTSWMSHGDSVKNLPDNFTLLAESDRFVAAAANLSRRMYGIQFHPEVTHCEYGNQILNNFACKICDAKPEWSVETFLSRETEKLRKGVGQKKVLLLISGGVDSTVVGALLLRALEPQNVHLMYIDTGLMRKNETQEVLANLKELGALHLHPVDASSDFYQNLAGISDPEEKRRIIGDLFISIQEREVDRLAIKNSLLAQGTLYPDMIESGKGIGKKAQVIKSHHNVNSPLVEAKRKAGLLIEPLSRLYKDEVRELGRLLGVSRNVVMRHPFPGPGLAVRIIGEVTEERCDILREADAIFIEELKKRNLYEQIWQAFCVLLPIRSVGVAGDARRYGYVLSLRAVASADAMTADVFAFEAIDLLEISSRITNSVKQIGRVVYDISSKPPATIEWE